MTVSDLSVSAQNYLKIIWAQHEWSNEPITGSALAERLGLKLSSVSDGLKRLVQQQLIEHKPYGSIELTDKGRAYAVQMVRRHRLIETFLVETLGYTWDQVHEEAEHLEHCVSDFMVERIDILLGRPSRDPHGDPIPSANGNIPELDAHKLTGVGAGTRVTVERISDDNAQLLQFFEQKGINVGSKLVVNEGAPFSGSIEVLPVGADSPVVLGTPATDALYVSISAE